MTENLKGVWLRPINYSFYLVVLQTDPLLCHHMTKILSYFVLARSKPDVNVTGVVQMKSYTLGCHQRILGQIFLGREEHLVHQRLECGWGIGETKWHNQKLKMTMMNLKCSFVGISWFHSNLVIT